MYAIFRALGKQFRAEKGQTLRLPLMDAEPGSTVTFDEVLLSSDGTTIRAGAPLVSGASVEAEVVARRLERSLKRAAHEHRERQLSVRLHPEVALYLLEEEPRLLQNLQKITGLDLELRDDPMMRLDEFRLMSRPAGRDVTELYAVA